MTTTRGAHGQDIDRSPLLTVAQAGEYLGTGERFIWGGPGQGTGPGPGNRVAPAGVVDLRDLRAAGRGRNPAQPHQRGRDPRRGSFGRLLRSPGEQASTAAATPGRDTRLPRTAELDFATWPPTVETDKAGLLLLVS